MTRPLFLVDAFTAVPFAGNPAAVVLLAGPAESRWMQSVALEMQQAETAFVHREVGDATRFGLRWFTPACEIDLCGHATLASAHVLWELREVAPDATIRFATRSGELSAARCDVGGAGAGHGGDAQAAGTWIELDFPSEAPHEAAPPPELLPALRLPAGVAPRYIGRNRMDWLVELASEAQVRALAPDPGALARIPARGVIVTARASASAPESAAPPREPAPDFVSRFFAPAAGVPEDPVTGSAHCALAPHWCARLGRAALLGWQASPRGGAVRVELAGARVKLRGQAVTVVRGELLADR